MNVPVVTPVCNWRNKKNKTGLYKIHLRIYLCPEPYRYYEVKIPKKIKTDQWSGKDDAWVNTTHPFWFEINNRISELKGKITDLTKRFYMQDKPITFYAIEREILRKGDRSLVNDYFRNYIDRPPETVTLEPATWEKYEAFLDHLNNFNPRIKFSDVDGTMIARIKNFLASQKGRKGLLEPATIKSYFDKFKVVLTHAARKDHLLDVQSLEEYFQEVVISVPRKKEGKHLEIGEVQALRGLAFDKKDRSLERDRDLFLFQVYTGFYHKDLTILKKRQLFKDVEYGYYIISERDKNENATIIPLFKFNYADTIIEKYRDHDPANEYLFRKDVFIEIQAYNRNLKLLATRAGIAREVSNKTARHTNAQMWIRFGAERPILSKMMGHEKEETTQNYYRVNLREVIEGTKMVDFDKFEI